MLNLGIFENQTIDEELLNAFQNNEYEVNIISEKKQIEEVDGVIFPLTKKEELPTLVNYLLNCQKKSATFIWIFSIIDLDVEKDILMSLGVNDVVIGKEKSSYLFLLVKNTFSRLSNVNLKKKNLGNQSFMNYKNQSVWINNSEQILTKKEFQLLNLLYENKSNCVLYETLMERLWPNSSIDELYNLTNTMFHLRKKMKHSENVVIRTVRSKGYMLIMI